MMHELMLYSDFDHPTYLHWCESDENCITAYLEKRSAISKVKAVVMEWIENVEEARMHVEETLHDEAATTETGAAMDPEKEHSELQCDEEGIEDDLEYIHIDPGEFLFVNSTSIINTQLCK